MPSPNNKERIMSVKEISAVALSVAVDGLGYVKARIAEEKAVEEGLKAVLIEAAAEGPESAFDGRDYRATVSFCSKKVMDYPAVLAMLKAQYGIPNVAVDLAVSKCTKVADGVPCVRVSARKG